MNYQVTYYQIAPNYGYSLVKIPQEVMSELKMIIDKQLTTNFKNYIPYNDKLAGEIKMMMLKIFFIKSKMRIKIPVTCL